MARPLPLVWTPQAFPATLTAAYFSSVAFGNGVFVAVLMQSTGAVTTSFYVSSSPDGVNWGAAQSFTKAAASLPRVSFANGLFLIPINPPTMIISSDGQNWTSLTGLPNIGATVTAAFGNGTYLSLANAATSSRTSPDGTTWTAHTGVVSDSSVLMANGQPVTVNANALVFGQGVFVAVGINPYAMHSTDGVTWHANANTGNAFGALASTPSVLGFGNGLFIALDGTTAVLNTSPDGINWTQQAALPSAGWGAVTYGDGLFVASGLNKVMTSPDGINWTQVAQATLTVSNFAAAFGNDTFVLTNVNNTQPLLLVNAAPPPPAGPPYVGIVYGVNTKTPYATIKPDDDSELDNPAWLNIGVNPTEPLAINKLSEATYNSWTSFAQLVAYVAAL